MNQQAFTLITMTALVAGLISVLVFAALRFAAAARDSKRHLSGAGMETALLSQALEDAITQLKAQERAMAARAEASERLSGQIVASLTAGVICLFTDLSAVVDLEEQLRLKDTLARLGELTAGLAHEFRNGLATVHGYARLLNLEALPPQDQKYVEGLRAETAALGEVVTNFLNFARPTQLAVTPIDLGQIAQRIAEELQADAAALGGRLVVGGVWAVVNGDEVLLRQALSNLARNAVEACAGAGVVPDVRIEATPDTAARVLRVQVIDNGPGIEPALRERVFRPFFTTKRDGTGLGLALVQKIVVTHNGRVQAAPGPEGRGTVIQVTLPLPELLPKVAV